MTCPFRKETTLDGEIYLPSGCACGTCALYMKQSQECSIKTIAKSLKTIAGNQET